MASSLKEFNPDHPLDSSKSPDQLWLIRIPPDFPLSHLSISNLEIPHQFTLETADGEEDYCLKDVDPLDLGELKDMQLIVPDAAHACYRGVKRPFDRFLSLQPSSITHDPQLLLKHGKEAQNAPYVARAHPPNLKFQSPPFGFETGKFL